jgi:hypothetical protein
VPTTGDAPQSYVIEVSASASFASLLTTIPVPTGTSFTVTAPPEAAGQTVYMRVRGLNEGGTGEASASQAVTFVAEGGGARGGSIVPEVPTDFTASALGLEVSGAWTAPAAGVVPTSYVVEAALSESFAAIAATIPVPTGTRFSVTAPLSAAGLTVFLRVRGVSSAGVGPPSATRRVTLVGPSAPEAPSAFSLSVTSGFLLAGTWSAPTTGSAPTSYLVEIAETSAFAEGYAVIPVPTGTSFAVQAPSSVAGRTYFARVRGVNAMGPGAPSRVQSISFGGGVAAPGLPGTFTVQAGAGRLVSGTWAPPTSGGTPTTYTVEVSTTAAFEAVLTTLTVSTGSSFSVTAPPETTGRTYFMRVRGVNAAGGGPATGAVAVTVAP